MFSFTPLVSHLRFLYSMHFLRLAILTLVGHLSMVLAKKGPITVAYVEVNSNSIDNTARYQLADGSNVFDIAIIFASNLHYNNSHATWYNNPNVQAILDKAAAEIKPLQQKGIKVLLSLLGGGTGKGIANFASAKEAAAFAKKAAYQVHTYGLDGVDFDDEYADYGSNGMPPANAQSFGWFLEALRKELPDKLITLYNIGPAAQYLSEGNATVGGMLNYSWNPYYGSFSPPAIPGLKKKQLGAAAIAIEGTAVDTAKKLATETLQQGYGVYLTYNLANGNQSDYVGAFAQVLYGQSTKYVPFP